MEDPTQRYRIAVSRDGQRAMRVTKRVGRNYPRLLPGWRWATEDDAHHAEVRVVIEARRAAIEERHRALEERRRGRRRGGE